MEDKKSKKLTELKAGEDGSATSYALNPRTVLSRKMAARIRMLAKAMDIPVTTALANAGVSANLVSNMAARDSIPSSDIIVSVAEYFDVPLDYLVGRPPKDAEYAEILLGVEDVLKILRITDESIKPEKRALFYDFLKTQIIAFQKIAGALDVEEGNVTDEEPIEAEAE
jgi:transcriptional regulator with XRE-family HTH domain